MSIPATLDALTPAWLTQALRSTGQIGDASVASVQVEPVGQGVGLLCQLARLTLAYDRPADGAPASLVAKIPTTDPQTRGMVSMFKFYEREVRFYDEVAAQISLPTPRCYYSAFDAASGDFILLLEDLAGCHLGDQLASCSVEEAKLAIAELARVHAAWWNSPRLDELSWMPDADDPINKAGMTLYPMAWGPFIERFGSKLPAEMREVGKRLGGSFDRILNQFVAGPRTVCHGDYRLDNLFFGRAAGQPPVTAIDWQIAIRAVGTYDVGYFMSQSLEVAARRAHEMDILRMYHALLVEGGVTDYSFEQCLADYRRTLLFCFAYPVMGGGLGDLSNERGYALGHAMMERSAAAIMDWKAGELLDS